MKLKYLNVSSIIEDIKSFRDYEDLTVPQIKKYASEFVRKVETCEQFEHKVALLNVVDNTASLPDDHAMLLQVAYRDGKPPKPRRRIELTEWIANAYDGSGCSYKITKECPNCHETECSCNGQYVTIDVDDLWRQQHPEYQYMHMDWLYRWGGMNKDNIPTSSYNPEFRLIRYRQHNYSNADYHIGGCMNLDKKLMSHCEIEYSIHNGIIKLNREDGELLIAYMAHETDEEGYRLIPDIPEMIEGIQWYIEEKISYKEFRKGRYIVNQKNNVDFSAHSHAHQMRIKIQAVIEEKLQMPSHTAWMAFLNNNWKRRIPNNNNFFGRMNSFTPDSYESMMDRLTRK